MIIEGRILDWPRIIWGDFIDWLLVADETDVTECTDPHCDVCRYHKAHHL
jgi:hypothetical protein